MPRKKSKRYLLKLFPLQPKKKGEVEKVYVTGATAKFTLDAADGRGIHLEIYGIDGGVVFAVPSTRLISLEDMDSVKSDGVSVSGTLTPSNVVPLIK